MINIHINGLVAEKAHFFISENRKRCLLGLDIQPKRGIVTTQVKTTSSQIEENEAAKSEESEELQFWKKKFMEKNVTTYSFGSEGLRTTKFLQFLHRRWYSFTRPREGS